MRELRGCETEGARAWKVEASNSDSFPHFLSSLSFLTLNSDSPPPAPPSPKFAVLCFSPAEEAIRVREQILQKRTIIIFYLRGKILKYISHGKTSQ